MSKTPRKPIDNGDGTHLVPLTQGHYAIVDSADAERPEICGRCWCAKVSKDGSSRTVYAAARDKHGGYRLHRVILGASGDIEVDHVDGNGLNNRRANLRLATGAQNKRNTAVKRSNKSGYKGVHWHAHSGLWQARIKDQSGRIVSLGYHKTPELAARAYDAAALLIDPVFAHTNFDRSEYDKAV